MATITISEIYSEVFGGLKAKYLVFRRGEMDKVNSPNYQEQQQMPEESFDVLSPLGTPIIETVSLEGGKYDTYEYVDGEIKPRKVGFTDYTFALPPMVDVSQDKVIVKTPITGRDGTVKEYIYTDDFKITLRGLLIGKGNTYPYEQRRALSAVFAVNEAYGITAKSLNDMGIYSIVFESLTFNDLEGYNNVCSYALTGCSDMAAILQIEKL